MLQIGFFLSGSDDQRHILVPFGTFILLFRVSGQFGHLERGKLRRLHPLQKIKVHHRYFLFQSLVGRHDKRTLAGLYRCSLFAEVRKHVPFAAEHPFADALLHRKRIRLFRLETGGDCRDSHIRPDKLRQCRPRTHAAHHHGIRCCAEYPSRAFFPSVRTVGRFAPCLDFLGKRRAVQGLRETEQARFGGLADDVVG